MSVVISLLIYILKSITLFFLIIKNHSNKSELNYLYNMVILGEVISSRAESNKNS